MEKKWLWVLVVLIGIILGIVFGVYAYRNGGLSNTNMKNTKKLADVENSQADQMQDNLTTNQTIETSSANMNVSPNAIIIEKRYYKKCDHLIKETIDIPEDLINKTEEDVKQKYANWKLEGYSPKEIVVYKEYEGICNEHYVVKEHNGVIGIYIENNDGIQEWQEDTEIETQYLPEEDLENLKVGVKVVGKVNLNTFLEDYE